MRDRKMPNTVVGNINWFQDLEYKWVVTPDGRYHKLEDYRKKNASDNRACFGMESPGGDILLWLKDQSYMEQPLLTIKRTKEVQVAAH